MNILLLTQVLPYPPDSGPKVKTWNVLKYIAQRHRVTLVSFVRGDQTRELGQLKAYFHATSPLSGVFSVPMQRGPLQDGLALVRSLASGMPWMIARDDRTAMRRMVDHLAKENHFDVVHADQVNMSQYAFRLPAVRKVLDAHNALWLLYKRLWQALDGGPQKWLLGRDWRLLKRYEGRVCQQFDTLLAVSQEDRLALEEARAEAGGGGHPITVVPIAIDTGEVTQVQRSPNADHILHIGTMYWPPNIDGIRWFIKDVYPLIRAQYPQARLDLLGARPPEDLLALNGKDGGIHVAGYVADPTSYLESAGVMVVPLRAAGGMRVKILNALAQGVPVVSTSLGCEGIAVESGRHLLVGDSAPEFAQAVIKVLSDWELAARLVQNGRRLVESLYDYRVACRPLDQVYFGESG